MHQRHIAQKIIGGGCNRGHNLFEKIISVENLFCAWREFKKGKSKKSDVQDFAFCLEDNIFSLHSELKHKTYQHSEYTSFFVSDPKLRHIHKACVRDRVVHHALFRVLYQVFDQSFVYDSYSCRIGKGTHLSVSRLTRFCLKMSHNNIHNFYSLKCDIKKFFDSIDKDILLALIRKKVKNEQTNWLVEKIICSYKGNLGKGLPLGNVTSQLFANIYLNELDQFIKHTLKVKYYLRYCDDFVMLAKDKYTLLNYIPMIRNFLHNTLHLYLHADKIILRTYSQGIDWLGYVVLPHYKVLRTRTKQRIIKKITHRHTELGQGIITREAFNQFLQSYIGVLAHCQGQKIKNNILRMIRINIDS